MLGLFVQFFVVFLAGCALYRSVRLRFWVGTLGGVLRIAVAVGAIPIGLRLSFPPSGGPSASTAALALALGVVGPVVSLAVLYVAYSATRDVPVAEEQRLSPRFGAWLPIACIDAVLLAIAVIGQLLTSPW